MHMRMRHRLSIPGLLTVAALGGCGGDDSDDSATSVADTETATDPSSDTSADATASTSTSESSSEGGSTSLTDTGSETGTGSESDTGSDSTADSGSDTGEQCFGDGSMPACDVTEQGDCEAIDICLWTEPGYCSANCVVITDATTCCEQFECAWMAGACDYNAI